MSGNVSPTSLRFGPYRLVTAPSPGLGLVVTGLMPVDESGQAPAGPRSDSPPPPPVDYVNDHLLLPPHQEAFFALIDQVGLVVCKHLGGTDQGHREVRGRSSRGRMSQGEYYHHDGCTGPIKPRVVEIRCPQQAVARHTATAIAPYPEVLYAMLAQLPAELRSLPGLVHWQAVLDKHGELPPPSWDVVQGSLNRVIKRGLSAEQARAYFRAVDDRAGAFREPWAMNESRFIANANASRTMQHRRAYLEVHDGGRPNGHLVKRWPADPELELEHDA